MIQTPKSISILLITDTPDDYSNQVIREALTELGSLHINIAGKMLPFQENTYDLIILDTEAVVDMPETVSRIHALDPKVRIVVISTSPSWKDAKAAIQAGAIDYINKSLSKQEYFFLFNGILAKIPSQ